MTTLEILVQLLIAVLMAIIVQNYFEIKRKDREIRLWKNLTDVLEINLKLERKLNTNNKQLISQLEKELSLKKTTKKR